MMANPFYVDIFYKTIFVNPRKKCGQKIYTLFEKKSAKIKSFVLTLNGMKKKGAVENQ